MNIPQTTPLPTAQIRWNDQSDGEFARSTGCTTERPCGVWFDSRHCPSGILSQRREREPMGETTAGDRLVDASVSQED